MKKEDFITPKHAEGIGWVVIAWALLERQVLKAFLNLLNTPKLETIVLFWHVSFKERIARLSALIALKHENPDDRVRREFDVLLTRLRQMEEIRNMVAHSVWTKGTEPNAIAPFIMKAQGTKLKFSGLNIPFEQFTPDRLGGEAKTIERLTQDLKHFLSVHFPEPAKDKKEAAD